MDQALAELRDRLGQLTDLRRTEGLLLWDMTVFMPSGGAPTRAAQLATLEDIIHDRVVDDRFGELFAELEPYAATLPHDSDDAALVRVAQRDWDRARRVPTELAVEFAEVSAQSYEAWVKAREESDFASLPPLARAHPRPATPLRRVLRPVRRPLRRPARGLRVRHDARAEIREIFAVLTPELRSLVAAHASEDEDGFMTRAVPRRAARRRSRGSSWNAFGVTLGPVPPRHDRPSVRDHVRPRRRPPDEPLREDDLLSLFTAMHEMRPRPLRVGRQPDRSSARRSAAGVSSTLHESQSRLWENVVGRSLPFWSWFYPRVQETFPDRSAASRSRASTGRSTACAARSSASTPTRRATASTSSSASSSSRSSSPAASTVADLPDAWNARFEELIGVAVPNDSLGVLQDAHWSGGALRLLPDLPPRQRALRADLGDCPRGDSGRRRADRPRRVRASARVAAREHLRPRPQADARRDSSNASSAARSTRSRTSRTCARSSTRRLPLSEPGRSASRRGPSRERPRRRGREVARCVTSSPSSRLVMWQPRRRRGRRPARWPSTASASR